MKFIVTVDLNRKHPDKLKSQRWMDAATNVRHGATDLFIGWKIITISRQFVTNMTDVTEHAT
jgi:hypothetical protein